MRIVVIIIILIIKLYSYKVPTALLFSIAKAENCNIFYPYIISINSRKDIKKLRKIKENLNLKLNIKNKTIYCYNLKNCVKISKSLIKKGIINIDLGSFQINYKYHKLPLSYYFNIKKSAKFVDNYIFNLAKNFKMWNWKILAAYHSFTPKENTKYIILVNKYYSKLFNKKNINLIKEYKKFLKIIY